MLFGIRHPMQTRTTKPLSLLEQERRRDRAEQLRDQLPWVVVAALSMFVAGVVVGVWG